MVKPIPESDKVLITDEIIQNKIFTIRGVQVMLDRDLAELYGVKAIRLREQVRRNIDKFPSHFMFQLTEDEVDIMVSQNAIPSKQHLGGALPLAFAEHGVLMLSNVLKSKLAIKVSIRLIEIFVHIRKSLNVYTELKLEIELIKKKLGNHDKNIEIVFQYLDGMSEQKTETITERKKIGFEFDRKK